MSRVGFKVSFGKTNIQWFFPLKKQSQLSKSCPVTLIILENSSASGWMDHVSSTNAEKNNWNHTDFPVEKNIVGDILTFTYLNFMKDLTHKEKHGLHAAETTILGTTVGWTTVSFESWVQKLGNLEISTNQPNKHFTHLSLSLYERTHVESLILLVVFVRDSGWTKS